jgi:glycerophosphoryl diester phosphodiesterase
VGNEGGTPSLGSLFGRGELDSRVNFDAGVEGPPWILGHRGSPREAPENTLLSLRRAIDLGLDGVEYDLHACASGEAVLIHDETLDRTTDHHGLVSELTLPELAHVDAGGWFNKRSAGEPLPLLGEALELPGSRPGEAPRHMIELKDPGLVSEVARELSELSRPLRVHIASFHREVCLGARDSGVPSMLLAVEATESDRRFVRDEGISAHSVGPYGWRTEAGRQTWDCERWAWSVDDPEDILECCRGDLTGFNTNEPLRALGLRALAKIAGQGAESVPLLIPKLEVPYVADARDRGRHGEWAGRWQPTVTVTNPFGFPIEVALALRVRGGAFEVEGLPCAFELEPHAVLDVPVTLSGGSWSPGDDPVLLARMKWRMGPGRSQGELLFDAPIERIRRVQLGTSALRLPLLSERPGERTGTMTLRLRGEEVLVSIEDAGGLQETRALLRLGAEVHRGAHGVRARLPEAFRHDPRGIPFSVGLLGLDPERPDAGRVLRRFSGGLPAGIFGGAPARLFLQPDA